ncbi:energy-coupling factor transporter ATPase [Aerococcus kribbianus]|uniref:Energy-coupling factor transporter ATP-binding protein EcfA2 n=1 Tax=Aerococcus kribbianus TaxID=2999064 RepID=A0A9X3FPH5_9LACT|nr:MULTISPECIES: energy-coupling factor transporter ATPase [unclassified Aerococcus]MCZ0718084.1 energy-coupling factor transporter ATPase [Aerococcus sp. YH-aer221]MCZ0726347.1 energy-coupling factor transporter ATPase [Aerococcus sp. YH-aer222]
MQISAQDIAYIYSPDTPFASQALSQVSFTIPDRSYTAIIGHTGSGKSTITRLLNGLILPSSGQLKVGDVVITPDSRQKDIKIIRQKIGMVFQFPEAQLFEETVLKDVMFGPQNYGASPKEAEEMARQALKRVEISDDLLDRSPFDLSGGQMRRVAIAGVLAMAPEVLILDEPTAGLDPKGQAELMGIFQNLYQEKAMTIVLVTHQMNDVANYANHVIVMDAGTCIQSGQPQEIFANLDWLTRHQLALPDTLDFKQKLQAMDSSYASDRLELSLEELADSIAEHWRVKRREGGYEG